MSIAVAGSLLRCGGDTTEVGLWAQSESRVMAVAGQSADGLSAASAGGSDGSRAADTSYAGASASGSISSYAWINEVKMDPPGTDGNYEFIELRGEPSTNLTGHWLVTVEGDSDSNLGQLDTVIDLSACGMGPCQFDERGLLLLVADPLATVPATGAFWRLSSELAKGGLENGTTSLLVIVGSLGSSAQDWDIDDNGELELPANLVIKDSVGWFDGDAGDVNYTSAVLGPKPKPHAIWLCNASAGVKEWRLGQLLGEAPSLAVDVAHSVPGGLEAFDLTPGEPNSCQSPAPVDSTPLAAAGAGGASAAVLSAAAGCSTIPPAIGSTGTGGSSTRGASDAPTGNVAVAVSNAPAGGRDTRTSLEGPGGSTSTLTSELAAGCSPIQPLLVAAQRTVRAGNSGWWSPNPFASLLGGRPTSANTSAGSVDVSAESSGTSGGPPQLPGSCAVSRLPVQGSGLLLLVLAFISVGRLAGSKPRGREAVVSNTQSAGCRLTLRRSALAPSRPFRYTRVRKCRTERFGTCADAMNG